MTFLKGHVFLVFTVHRRMLRIYSADWNNKDIDIFDSVK